MPDEEFFDSYVDFVNKYNDTSSDDQTGMLSDYADFMTRYADYMKKLDEIEEENLSTTNYAYYIEVQARITKKLSVCEPARKNGLFSKMLDFACFLGIIKKEVDRFLREKTCYF